MRLDVIQHNGWFLKYHQSSFMVALAASYLQTQSTYHIIMIYSMPLNNLCYATNIVVNTTQHCRHCLTMD